MLWRLAEARVQLGMGTVFVFPELLATAKLGWVLSQVEVFTRICLALESVLSSLVGFNPPRPLWRRRLSQMFFPSSKSPRISTPSTSRMNGV